MNSNKIPGEQLRKELIANHYSNDFLKDFNHSFGLFLVKNRFLT